MTAAPVPASVVAIGDIHGGRALLDDLLARIEREWAGQWEHLVFIGDYIDRGPDSPGVIDRCLDVERRYPGRVTFLSGNHEQWMLQRRTGWLLSMEGLTTVEQYDAALADEFQRLIREYGPRLILPGPDKPDLPFDRLFHAAMPPAHLDFFQRLERYYRVPGAIFVHAGLRPDVPLEEQTDDDLFGIGGEFHEGYAGTERVIFGHFGTRQLRPDGRPDVWLGANHVVGIDTGHVDTGVLTAWRWPDGAVLQTEPATA